MMLKYVIHWCSSACKLSAIFRLKSLSWIILSFSASVVDTSKLIFLPIFFCFCLKLIESDKALCWPNSKSPWVPGTTSELAPSCFPLLFLICCLILSHLLTSSPSSSPATVGQMPLPKLLLLHWLAALHIVFNTRPHPQHWTRRNLQKQRECLPFVFLTLFLPS